MPCRTLIPVAILLLVPGIVQAGDLTFTATMVANFEFSLVGYTAINPGPTTPFIPFEAIGKLTFSVNASINDPSQPTTVPFTNVTGELNGVPPSPSMFLPFTISPDVQFIGGDLTNIVRDSHGNVTSADVSNLSMRWDMIGPGGLTLFTLDGLPFNGSITSLPFSIGTVLSGPDPFNVYLQGGGPDPVVIGRNRILTSIPEPSSLVLLGAGVAGLGLGCQKRRRARQ